MALNSHVNKITAATNGRKATGWRIYASTAYSSIKKHSNNNNEFWQKRCSNGGKNWWGWCVGNCGTGRYGLGRIETTLKGCGTARLDFGNCYTSTCVVNVYVDGRRISTANRNTPHKVVQFNYDNGSKLKITAFHGCMMTFNSFKVISCRKCLPGIVNSTKPIFIQ